MLLAAPPLPLHIHPQTSVHQNAKSIHSGVKPRQQSFVMKLMSSHKDTIPLSLLSPPCNEDFVSHSVLEALCINIGRTEGSLGTSTSLLPIWRHEELLQRWLQQHLTSPFSAARTVLRSSGKENRYDN